MPSDKFILQIMEEETRGSALLDLFFTNRDEIVEGDNIVRTLGENDDVTLEFTKGRLR